ncbi:MAG: PAS domain S-box protein [Bacteroidetes bacterium]|nr:PAS domain S-box protein [Bacteroidota bacterium]
MLLFLTFYGTSTFSSEGFRENRKMASFSVVDSLNKTAEICLENNLELTKFSASKALNLSNQIKYTKGQAGALLALSKYYIAREDYVKTLETYFKMIDIYGHDIDSLVVGYSRVCQFFLNIHDYDLANKYLALMTRIAQISYNPDTYGQVFASRAKYYYARHENNLAIRDLYLSILHFHKNHNLYGEGSAHKALGDAFVQKKMYAKAAYNYRLAISFFSRKQNDAEIAIIFTRIAHIYQLLNDNKLNLEYNLSAMRIREKIGSQKLISSSYLNVGEAYWLLDKKDSAHFYLRKSLQLAKQIRSTYQLEAVYSQMANFANAEMKYADALKYFILGAEYRTKMNHDQNKTEILILEANRAIRATEAQNDLLKQENTIQSLKIRNRRIQIFVFEAAFIIMLFLILFADTLARKNRKRKNELKELNDNLTQEIKFRIEAEGRLTRSEELHRFLAENTVDVISLMDVNMHRLYISPSCEKFYGYDTQEILQMRSPLVLVEPSFHISVNQHLLEMFRSKKSIRYIYKVLRKDGSTFWAEANINPVLDPGTNEVKNLTTVVRDISERMKHEEELSENSRQKEYLLREIHNRVKNNFAILVSLMNMQRDQSENPELGNSLTDLQLRVRAMSLVHEQLYQTQEISTIPFDNYLHHLTLIISSSFNNSRIRLQTEIHPCIVAIEMALPLGLIINELITNAYKYAFPGDQTGTIWVKLIPENEKKFSITISDDGIGLPANFTMNATQTMGSQIVGILIDQIEGSLEVSGNGGACFRILFSTSQEK